MPALNISVHFYYSLYDRRRCLDCTVVGGHRRCERIGIQALFPSLHHRKEGNRKRLQFIHTFTDRPYRISNDLITTEFFNFRLVVT